MDSPEWIDPNRPAPKILWQLIAEARETDCDL
jgi:hypothetical protein